MRLNWGVLPLRFAVGAIFVAHGAQKLFGAFDGYGITKTAEGFGLIGLNPSLFWAWVVAIAEFFGGLGLLFGLLTRLSAAALVTNMAVAICLVHLKNGFFAGNGGYEYPMLLMAASISLVILGPGDYSLDALVGKWWRSRRASGGRSRT